MLRTKEVEHGDVIEYMKVLFYKSLESSDFAERAHRKLKKHAKDFGLREDATVDELKTGALAVQLRCLMDKVEPAIEAHGEAHLFTTKQAIQEYPRRVFISVPGMWTPAGNRCMTEGAKKAGLKSVTLVRESQAAAAYWLQRMVVHKEGTYKPGDRIQVLDAGGGTSDTTAYEVQAHDAASVDGDPGDAAKLVSMGDASGAPSGSEYVNQAFLRWLVHKIKLDYLRTQWPGGLSALCKHLSLTEAQVLEYAQLDFQDLDLVQAKYVPGFEVLLKGMNVSEAKFLNEANIQFTKIKHDLQKHNFEPESRAEHKIWIDGDNGGRDHQLRLTRSVIFYERDDQAV